MKVTNAKDKETMFPKIEEINWHVIKMFGAAVSEKVMACCARILARVWLARAELKRRAEHPCLWSRTHAFQPENAEWWGGQATIVPNVNSTTGESVILVVRLGSDSRIAVRVRVPRFVAC